MPRRTLVRLVTEGTYPYVIGGVSSWCDLLVNGLTEVDWELLPITAGGRAQQPVFTVADHVRLAPAIDLWSLDISRGGRGSRGARRDADLPGRLVRSLLCWDNDHADLVDALVWCRLHPGAVRAVFRSRAGWESFLAGLRSVEEENSGFSAPTPHVDAARAGQLYTTMHWIAQTAARATSRADLSHVTAAGWSMVPAAVDKAMFGTPVLLTEHGVFVREAYLAAVRGAGDAVERFVSSRLAWGLARLSYRTADVVSPVADANRHWEVALGVDADRIVTIYNGVDAPEAPTPLPGTRTVTSVGRLDPLKDTATMLRMAAEVRRHDPSVQFVHYGPVPQGQEEYARSCYELHEALELGDGFRFMGGTSDPRGAMRAADVVVLTSISEGFPIAVLEAMAEGRPVVSTAVGGVLEAIQGAGVTAPPGDVHRLAAGVLTLLRDPDLAARLGRRGFERVQRKFGRTDFLGRYRELIHQMSSTACATASPHS